MSAILLYTDDSLQWGRIQAWVSGNEVVDAFLELAVS